MRNLLSVYRRHEPSLSLQNLNSTLAGSARGNSRFVEIKGQYNGTPVNIQLRLKRSGYTILVQVPLTTDFRLSVLPKGSRRPSGTTIVQASDQWLSSCKSVWADNHALAQSLTANKRLLETLKATCASPLLEVSITGRTLKLKGEAPESFVSEDALIELVTNLATLKRLLRAVSRPERELVNSHGPRWMRATVAVCVIVLSAIGLIAIGMTKQRASVPQHESHAFVDPEWKTINVGDLDSASGGWVRAHAQKVRGSFELKSANTETNAQVDILKKLTADSSPLYRIVVQLKGKVVFDQVYPALAIALPVSTGDLARIRWMGHKPAADIEPEALLIIKKDSDLSSGEVLTWEKDSIHSYRPQDFSQF